jgi:nitroreductase
MEFHTLIKERYSVRAYKPDPVPQEALESVLEAAQLAPTANNQQPFRLIVVHTEGREAELKRIYSRAWFVEAPILICACGLPEEAWRHKSGQSYLYVDIAIVMDHAILAATELGLGTCWVAAFDHQVASELLSLPSGVEPIIFTPLGYPADQPKPKERRSLSDLVRYEAW